MNETWKSRMLWISGGVTIVIMLVMNLLLIPSIEAAAGGIHIFDMQSTGYSHTLALTFLQHLTDSGRRLYLFAQLPLDFVYPVAYTIFFLLLVNRFGSGRVQYIPFVLLPLFDYTENISTLWMLTSGTPAASFTAFASSVTVVKSMLMYLCFAIVLVLLFRKIVKRDGHA